MSSNRPTREDLVKVIAASGVRDRRVLDAIAAVPRAEFVPAESREIAYVDEPIPIPHGQVTTQPSLVARMVEALALAGPERVLEVGSGYGWQTALLAQLAAQVWSIERFADVAATARERLERFRVVNADVIVGDGSEGWEPRAPYEAIIVAAAFPDVPAPLASQLAPHGRLVQPLGFGGSERVVLFARRGRGLARVRTLTGARFVRLVGRHGFPT